MPFSRSAIGVTKWRLQSFTRAALTEVALQQERIFLVLSSVFNINSHSDADSLLKFKFTKKYIAKIAINIQWNSGKS